MECEDEDSRVLCPLKCPAVFSADAPSGGHQLHLRGLEGRREDPLHPERHEHPRGRGPDRQHDPVIQGKWPITSCLSRPLHSLLGLRQGIKA